jgi:hypothetical protein
MPSDLIRGGHRLREENASKTKNWSNGSDSIGTVRALVRPFRLGHGLPDFSATVGALIDEVDLCHAPMRLDVSHIHRKQSDAAGADNRVRLDDVVMLDVGWHVGSPSQQVNFNPGSKPTASNQTPIINSIERLRNIHTILVHVTFL